MLHQQTLNAFITSGAIPGRGERILRPGLTTYRELSIV
jgi:hypothetical protein